MEARRLLRGLPLGAGLAVLALVLLLLPMALHVADEADRVSNGEQARPYRREMQPVSELAYPYIDSPTGLRGRWDVPGPVPRLRVYLSGDGRVLFKGHVTRLAEEGPATPREEIRRLTDKPGLRRLDGHSDIPVMIAAERLVACRHVRTLLDVLEEPEIGVDRIQWPLRHPVHGFKFRQDARRVAWRRPDEAEPAIDVHLAAPEEYERSLTARLGLGARTWWLPLSAEDRTLEMELIEENAWKGVAGAIEEAAKGAKHARILLRPDDDRLAWGHLARLIDTLVGAGIGSVEIPSWGLALELDVPPPVDVPEPRFDAAPVLTPVTLVACALAVVLAFAITFLPRRRGRRGKPQKNV